MPQSPLAPDEALPEYSRRAEALSSNASEPTQHVSQLKNRKQHPWLTLKLNSRSRSEKSQPLYFKADTITGSIDLDLENAESIQSISLSLRAETTGPHGRVYEFWKDSLTLWMAGAGNPSTRQNADTTKLKGSHSFPINYQIPTKLAVNETESEFDLPPTHPGAANVVYWIGVIIQRGKLKPNDKLWTEWIHGPRARAAPPSALRQVAYLEHSPLVGPTSDGDGWKTLEPVTISGELFSAKSVEVSYELSISQPLEFPRNSVIPLWLTIESANSQALDLLANPARIEMLLIQEDTWYSEVSSKIKEDDIPIYNVDPSKAYEAKAGKLLTCLTKANWWIPSKTDCDDDNKRVLEGEIHIPKQATPSFQFSRGRLTVSEVTSPKSRDMSRVPQYYVCLAPPIGTGFMRSKKSGALVAYAIKITTDAATGPRPTSYSPPGYNIDFTTNNEFLKWTTAIALEWK